MKRSFNWGAVLSTMVLLLTARSLHAESAGVYEIKESTVIHFEVSGDKALVDEFARLYQKVFVTPWTSGGLCSPYDVDLKDVGSKFEFICRPTSDSFTQAGAVFLQAQLKTQPKDRLSMTATLLPCTSRKCGLDPDATCTMYYRYSPFFASGCYHTQHPFESKHLCK